MSELKPCPFCGGEAHVVEGMYNSYQEGYAVRCRHCALTLGASGRLGECYEWSCCYENEAEAIEAWNTRAERTCHGESDLSEWVCSECQCWIPLGLTPENIKHASEWRYCPHCGAKVKAVKR